MMKSFNLIYAAAALLFAAAEVLCPAAAESARVTEIDSAERLAAFRDSVNAGDGYEGASVRLTADIDLQGAEWVPIGTADAPFSGKFNGAGHKISGLRITSRSAAAVPVGTTEYSGAALFLILSGRRAQIANLAVEGTVDNTRRRGNLLAGGIVAYAAADTVIFNCKSSVSVSVSGRGGPRSFGGEDYAIAGGVAAHLEGYMINCVNDGAVKSSGSSASSVAAGLVGRLNGYVLSSRNEGPVSAAGAGLFQNIAGGAVGVGEGGALFGVENEGDVYSSNVGGGVVGFARGTSIRNARNLGKVGGNGHRGAPVILGGVAGNACNGASLADCANLGAVDAARASEYVSAGGVAGLSNSGPNLPENVFSHCSNSALISGEGLTATRVGGLIGEMGKSRLVDSANSGAVNTGKAFAGGLVGKKFSDADVYDSVYPSGYDAVAYGTLSARDCTALPKDRLAGTAMTAAASLSTRPLVLAEGESRKLSVDSKARAGFAEGAGVLYSVVSADAAPAGNVAVSVEEGVLTVSGKRRGVSLLLVRALRRGNGPAGGAGKDDARKALFPVLAVVTEAAAASAVPPLWPEAFSLSVLSADISPVPRGGLDHPAAPTSGCDAGEWAIVSLVALPLALFLFARRNDQ